VSRISALNRYTEGKAITRAIDWTQHDTLKAQVLADREIARQWDIPWGTFHREKQKHDSGVPAQSSTPATRQRYTEDHPSTPDQQSTAAHPGPLSKTTRVHSGVPVVQSTTVHPSTSAQHSALDHSGVPIPHDAAMRLLSLLPDLEVMVARECDRQRLLSIPIGTPRHTVKKTDVIDTLYVDLIERYAQAEGVEFKDVVNLAFHEFFERRQYLPVEE
jgi:hypothetical protein